MKRRSTAGMVLSSLLLLGAAGGEQTSEVATGTGTAELTLTSKDFTEGGQIPVEQTCDGQDRSPALAWSGAPKETKAFAIVCEDPDAPGGTFVHWVIWNIPDAARALDGGVPVKAKLGDGTIQGKNDFGRVGYAGPCPPKGTKHHYVFRVFALRERLEPTEEADVKAVLSAAKKNSLADAKLTGTYERQ